MLERLEGLEKFFDDKVIEKFKEIIAVAVILNYSFRSIINYEKLYVKMYFLKNEKYVVTSYFFDENKKIKIVLINVDDEYMLYARDQIDAIDKILKSL